MVLDSDTVFFEPLELPATADVGVRAVDVKGSTSEGPGDPFDSYWTGLAEIAKVPLPRYSALNSLSSAKMNSPVGLIDHPL